MRTVILTTINDAADKPNRRGAIIADRFIAAYEYDLTRFPLDKPPVEEIATMVVYDTGGHETGSMLVANTLEEVLELFGGVAVLPASYKGVAFQVEDTTGVTLAADEKGFTHYVHVGLTGSVFCKEAAFFAEQGGHAQAWGAGWWGVTAKNDDEAREIAKREHRAATQT